MNTSEKLSWEIIALNDRENATDAERTALEVAYGVSLALSEPGSFSSVMAQIAEQVSDPQVQRYLRAYTARGLKQ